ncbi:MAG: rRNA pseudouridine synthase [Spirochaetaceae bacterium]|jgi:23S rRNA pseudouridine2605 synthase|nr:rRNA pseudouridine synthase [Spirochaetaceae bacterium]
MRLQVFLAHSGVASRRASEQLIVDGRVTVNGLVVRTLGTKVGPEDAVMCDGRPVKPEPILYHLALHKPAGFLCTQSDPENRPLARSLLPREIHERLYSAGRLDFLSSGLIIFTNDGDFAHKLSHPSSRIEKEYCIAATAPIPAALIDQFCAGLTIDGVYYKARSVERTGTKTLKICLIEGKNREIRRVFSHFHLHPKYLIRTRIGPVCLDDLPCGQSRPLTAAEIAALQNQSR